MAGQYRNLMFLLIKEAVISENFKELPPVLNGGADLQLQISHPSFPAFLLTPPLLSNYIYIYTATCVSGKLRTKENLQIYTFYSNFKYHSHFPINIQREGEGANWKKLSAAVFWLSIGRRIKFTYTGEKH